VDLRHVLFNPIVKVELALFGELNHRGGSEVFGDGINMVEGFGESSRFRIRGWSCRIP
jgi:hypothetical protein